MKTIASSVGLHGVNQPADVRTVQELLNAVPHEQGGPLRALRVDGLCGRITNGAIEKLQAKHWGWGRVTTRVEPTSSTWNLLLTFEPSEPDRPVIVASPPVVPVKSTSVRFQFTQAGTFGKLIKAENFYFLVSDEANQDSRALYYLNLDNRPALPSPLKWLAVLPFPVHVLDPLGADDWACDASLVETHSPTQYETLLVLKPAAARRTTELKLVIHRNEKTSGQGRSSVIQQARFELIDSSNRARAL